MTTILSLRPEIQLLSSETPPANAQCNKLVHRMPHIVILAFFFVYMPLTLEVKAPVNNI
jgi:hypothetical protein